MRFAIIHCCCRVWLLLHSPLAPRFTITGAGATFPFPIYAKVGGRVQKGHQRGDELSVHRLRRRHQADPVEDGGFRRLRHAAESRRIWPKTASCSSWRSSAAWCRSPISMP